MPTFFDTHAHINQPKFDDDLDQVIQRAALSGLEGIVAIGVDAVSSNECLELAKRYDLVHAAVGIQPNDVRDAKPTDWDHIVQLAKDANVVALGETGLDRYWDHTPFEQQQDYFDRHLRLSQSTNMPFIVHMRECEEEVLTMLRDARQRDPLRGVMHSFTGTVAGAAEAIELGLMISFAGMVTFKKSAELREVAKTIPLDKLLVETDSPYLSPEPVRKIKRNEPAHVVNTARHLADTRSENFDHFVEQTTKNARSLFLNRNGSLL